MKFFETPYIEVLKFAVEDIITVSGGEATTEEEEVIIPGINGMNCT